MPYVSQPSYFMSGAEALRHIQQIEGCTRSEAIKQLSAAIRDKQVVATWPTDKQVVASWLTENLRGPLVDFDFVITRSGKATTACHSEFLKPTPRPFEVIRKNVLRIWPVQAGAPVPTVVKPEPERSHATGHPRPIRDRIKAVIGGILPVRVDASVPMVAKPETEHSRVTARPRPIHDGIKAAINAIWPDGVPAGLKSKDRDRQIRAWLATNRHSVPASDQSLAKAVQRVLRDRRQM